MPAPSDYTFPGNVVELFIEQFTGNLTGVGVYVRRALRPVDENGSVGVIALDWVPEEYEIGGTTDPSIQVYLIRIEALLKYSDEEEGRMAHYELAASIRKMLYRNSGLRIPLFQLKDVSDGITERVQRVKFRQQRFAANELKGEFLFLSTSELTVETETV